MALDVQALEGERRAGAVAKQPLPAGGVGAADAVGAATLNPPASLIVPEAAETDALCLGTARRRVYTQHQPPDGAFCFSQTSMLPDPSQLTHLLRRWGEGDPQALDQLIPLVYDRMRQLAHQRLRSEAGGSLNTTGLVHEAYMKLVDAPQAGVRDRSYFLALASRVMRHLLVDHARARKAAKRGAGVAPSDLEDAIWVADEDIDAVAELDDALRKLESMDERRSRILEQRYFGGLTLEETAEALNISLATVKRELRSARAWLATELQGEPA